MRTTISRAIVAAVLGCGFPVAASAGELVVIVNAANAASAMDAKQVKTHFLKTTAAWDNGEKVRPVDVSGTSPGRVAFLAKVLGMSGAELERYWIERQYANADNPPSKVADDAAVIKLVGAFKGAVGFIDKASLPASQDQVKVILTVSY